MFSIGLPRNTNTLRMPSRFMKEASRFSNTHMLRTYGSHIFPSLSKDMGNQNWNVRESCLSTLLKWYAFLFYLLILV